MFFDAGRCESVEHRFCNRSVRLIAVLTMLLQVPFLYAADVEQIRKMLLKGEYAQCIQETSLAIQQRAFGEDWYLLKAEAEMQIGKYKDAFESISVGISRYAWSVRLRQAGIETARMSGNVDQANAWRSEINQIVGRGGARIDGDAESLVAVGKVAISAGMDAREVLERFYDRALRVTPSHRGATLASGELAIAKKDFALAAEIFDAGVKVNADDPDFHFGLARSIETAQPQLAAFHLSETLRLNPRHTVALVYKAEQAIDSELYADAAKLLDQALEINESHPLAWSLHAVMAHLDHELEREREFRDAALKSWAENPAVDHLIGRKLSQKYRFAEGADYQRSSLKLDPDYQPARVQLVQDLLRLGQDDEGWKLSESALKSDPYNVHVFNLMQLRDQLAKYNTIEVDGFRIRMDAKEAAIYGSDVLKLLQRAKQTLCAKYDLKLDELITVEIFADSNDFAVKAFNLPGAGGYLGICFGKVIIANSPAALQQITSNWQAVLWHEFCHAVTLEKTRNRMPRWLSEGLSVYEERQAGTNWGQRMNPKHRKRILANQLSSVREMSSSFLRPEKAGDLEFAYYQSSLLVECLIDKYGFDAMKKILDDLAAGLHVNDAIERHTATLDQIDFEFHDYAVEMARQLAPDVDWEQYDLSAIKDDDDPDRLEHWVEDHPNSIQGLTMLANQFVSRREFDKAKKLLEKLIELYPEQSGLDSSYLTLAAIHHELKEVADERRVLERYVQRASDAKTGLLRLIELQSSTGDWPAVSKSVLQLLEVNPLLPQAQKARATASEHLGQTDDAIQALKAWLLLEADDPADAHYRLAKLLQAKHDPEAKAHVLAALDYAPRYRDAQKLLLKIVREASNVTEQKQP
jgi:tetratricopeptide (TPR) repeat protein